MFILLQYAYLVNVKYKQTITHFDNMLKIKKISEVMNKHVYTAEGEYFGQVDDVNLMDNKVDGW